MSLQGPIFVAADRPVPQLLDALAAAGAFPIVKTPVGELATAIAAVEPAAVIMAEPPIGGSWSALERLLGGREPYTPLIVRIDRMASGPIGPALPVAADAPEARLIARLRGALRVRTLHASVLRRIAALEQPRNAPPIPHGDPLDEASVLVAGRGGRYPALVAAVGERTGLLGALGLDSALELLRARHFDGLMIGDGFNRSSVGHFIGELALDRRFRDLPIAVVDVVEESDGAEQLPNLSHGHGRPAVAVEHLMPLVRLHAFSTRLRRVMASLDAKGTIDPETGLCRSDAFARDLAHAISDAEARGAALSLARFSLGGSSDRRCRLDAARLVARLIRAADFGCRDSDASISVAFAETDLRTAHVLARRIASMLKHTTLAADPDRGPLDPTVTIVALRSRDTASTLLARARDPREAAVAS